MKRRDFLRNTGAKAGAVAIAASALGAVCSGGNDKPAKTADASATAASSAKKFKWKMVTTWPPKFPIFQTGAEQFAERVKKMSAGRLDIKVYAGGELIPPLGAFDAVSQGTVQVGHGAAYYWAGKVPEAQFFTAVPFGFTANQMNAWLYHGGGIELWNEMYEPFNLRAFPAGSTGVQMGGWFNKKIESMADIKGLKMRIPGLGGKVMNKAGANVVLLPASELYTALERGVLDALEWAGPYHDLKLGFYRAAKHYYYPGWHEPGSILEIFINKQAFESLPPDLQAIVESAIAQTNIDTLAEFNAKNGEALDELINKYNVQLEKFPDDVLRELRRLSDEVLEELAAENPKARKVYDAFKAFSAKIEPWSQRSEGAYVQAKAL